MKCLRENCPLPGMNMFFGYCDSTHFKYAHPSRMELIERIPESDKKNSCYFRDCNNDKYNRIINTSAYCPNHIIKELKRLKLLDEKDYKLEFILRNKINKNILRSKLINIFNELYINKEKIKKEKDDKDNALHKKLNLNIIKSKTINILRNFNDDFKIVNKIVNKIKNNKIKFNSKTINDIAIKNSRTKIELLSTLYKEKEIDKTLSNNDFMIAVNEYHKDKNPTRMTHLCKIMNKLHNNAIIYNSDIIFKHLYSFQYVKDYQIEYLISSIEKNI